MHIPHIYKNENLSEVKAFVENNSFGILVNTMDGIPWASHIPLELDKDADGQEVLYGHISKANPQWRYFSDNEKVLAIFNGPHAYVSSSWYNHENVPTWNYIAVHVYGKLVVLDNDELLLSLTKLVDKYEKGSDKPVKVEEMSSKTMRQINGIVGFKIVISDIQAAYKLSQNRDNEDYHNVVNKLESSSEPSTKQTGTEMKHRRSSDTK